MADFRGFSLVMIFALALFFAGAGAEIRTMEIRSDRRSIIPFDTFGFTAYGELNISVTDISFSSPKSQPSPRISKLGFFYCTADAWLHVLGKLRAGEIQCPLDSELTNKVFSFHTSTKNFASSVEVMEANQYTLLFANCEPDLEVSMNVQSVMYNLNPRTHRPDFLSAGKTPLPAIYFSLFLVYLILGILWVYTLYKNRLSVYRIHFFMLAVLILKALNLLCEAEDKSYIKRTGSAHGWDVLFYIFSFMKGISLFTLIVLIGTGWSFLKPYLQDKERNVLIIVIPLQVVANVAQVVTDETGPFGENSYRWKQVFLLVDILCCCAVLFPIVWSIKNLREAAKTDGKAAVNLMKLTLFRQYYVIVICYIYFTRVVVYALETVTSYRYQWTSVVASELATLAFYGFTGYNFRPKAHNPYFALDDREEEAAAEALKLQDEFEL
nr:protein GPR107-like [Ipomoea batatas]GMC93063.1 protein GPR107-like [Ipomoea batatas]GMC96455.1 protein GPR107-like [Ipomoea batatas]GMC98633.1 protein GPR107-like [Ipomoea batatas]GMD20505.1 protein GPR107-like [Ipomoea batatas]